MEGGEEQREQGHKRFLECDISAFSLYDIGETGDMGASPKKQLHLRKKSTPKQLYRKNKPQTQH